MTFLPFADFAQSAKCLDLRRLQNQRTEARFVLDNPSPRPYARDARRDTLHHRPSTPNQVRARVAGWHGVRSWGLRRRTHVGRLEGRFGFVRSMHHSVCHSKCMGYESCLLHITVHVSNAITKRVALHCMLHLSPRMLDTVQARWAARRMHAHKVL